MPSDPPRIILEKSRTVRRRYQRSNKRFQFTPSQIERIERDEERERRAQKLREKEKKRIANKKKRAEKEAKEREERRRQGLPDPDAPTVPSSQPKLFNFLKGHQPGPLVLETLPEETGTETEGTEDGATPNSSSGSVLGDLDGDIGSGEEDYDDAGFAECAEAGAGAVAAAATEAVQGALSTEYSDGGKEQTKDDDEFSDCSIFYDEDIIKEAETMATAKEPDVQVQPPRDRRATNRSFLRVESFRDETADWMEEFAHELLDAEEGSGRGPLVRRNAG